MTWLAIAAAVVLFAWTLKRSRAVESTTLAVATARLAMTSLLNPALSDEEKERTARSSSARLFMHSLSIAARLVLALAIPTAFLAALVVAKVLNLPSLAGALESWEVILGSTLVVGAALFWKR